MVENEKHNQANDAEQQVQNQVSVKRKDRVTEDFEQNEPPITIIPSWMLEYPGISPQQKKSEQDDLPQQNAPKEQEDSQQNNKSSSETNTESDN